MQLDIFQKDNQLDMFNDKKTKTINRIVLIGCVSGKHNVTSARAEDLYHSVLWYKRLNHAKQAVAANGGIWGILSAKHGVLCPDDEVRSYEWTMKDATRQARIGFGWRNLNGGILNGLRRLTHNVFDGQLVDEIVVYAGAEYVEAVRRALQQYEVLPNFPAPKVIAPLEGMQIGERLRWYNEQEEQRKSETEAERLEMLKQLDAALASCAANIAAVEDSSEQEGWTRTSSRSGCGSFYSHTSGWCLQHCGHPTAIFPYCAFDPQGEPVVSENGKAFQTVKKAFAELERRFGITSKRTKK